MISAFGVLPRRILKFVPTFRLTLLLPSSGSIQIIRLLMYSVNIMIIIIFLLTKIKMPKRYILRPEI